MAEQGRTRERAEAWGLGWGSGAPWRPSLAWPAGLIRFAGHSARHLKAWALADIGPGRLVPWLAIAFGFGIVLYFTADREPALSAALAVAAGTSALAVLARNRPVGFPVTLALAAIAAGFATATIKQVIIAHPVLPVATWNVAVTGFVETREERERSDRIVVRVRTIEAPRLNEKIERVRVSVRKGTAPAVGAFVSFKARLTPPLEPLFPGGYDFARDMYFHGIGASGFVLGRIQELEPPVQGGFWLRYASTIDGLREAMDKRIRSFLPGDKGAIASALITGKRDAITTPVNDAMYISGIGHVLSISGYHMVIVVGIVFFVIRASLALVPSLARRPIKKWAALAALGAATFYLLLSGAEVATQRSYIMIAIVLAGVLVDRPALTLRTLTVAAFGVLLLAPESVVHPSFQMSFAATLALVAGYAGGANWLAAGADTPRGARIALWGGRQAVFLILSSLIAGLATTLYAAYHFHRLAPYGVIANLLAMPVVSGWVMPMGIIGALTMPFGFDGLFWRGMGIGIDWMIAVTLWVASLPGAVGRMPAFGVGPVLLGSASLVVICLLKSPLRVAGVALGIGAAVWAANAPQPDVLASGNGEIVAVRSSAGRLAVVRAGNDTFAVQQWLAADADARTAKDETLKEGTACDDAGCVVRLSDGAVVAVARTLEAFEEDCRRAILVVSPRAAPPGCDTTVADRKVFQRNGALALRRTGMGMGERWEITAARPDGTDRPWARPLRPPGQGEGTGAPSGTRRPPGDATPTPETLEPGD